MPTSSSALAEPVQRRWLAFTVVLIAAVMDLLDTTIAQVAAPAIRRDLGGSYSVTEWISAAYTLAMAVGLLTSGRLGDLFGRRRVLLTGMAGFVAASAACALASDPGQLIAARAAQGLFGALMLPQVFGLIRDLFPDAEIGKAFGVFGPAMGLSAMLGPIVAGGLISANIAGSGWRAIFLVNVPVGAVALLVGARLLPAPPPAAQRAHLDLIGAALAGVGMFLLVYPLAEGQTLNWPAWTLAMLAGSVLVLGVFAAQAVWRKRSGRSPLVEPGIFTRRAYSAGIAFSVVFIGAMGGIVLILNVFLQAGLGFSVWHSAITTAPWAAGAFVGSAISGITMAKLGRRILHAGVIIEALGLVLVFLVLRSAGGTVTSLDLLAPMIIGGAGMGMVFVPLFDIINAAVEPHEVGSAAGVLQTVQALSMSMGVAGLGAIFIAILRTRAGHIPAFVDAAQWTTLITAALLAAAAVIAFWLPRHARPLDVLVADAKIADVGLEANQLTVRS